MSDIIISRVWEMPHKWTFRMKTCQKVFSKYVMDGELWVDPFAGVCSPAFLRNDIEGDAGGRDTTHQMDGLEFLQSLDTASVQGVLFDPPYSTEQCLRKYTPKFKGTAGRAEYWGKCKDEISRIVEPYGKTISFGWDSMGVGKKRGFEIIEIVLICHGACHRDTIITIDVKAGK